MECLDAVCNVATVIIAAVNVYFVCVLFSRNKKRELVKTYIVDYSIKNFYDYFEKLDLELSKLKNQCDIPVKKEIEKNVQLLGRIFEQRFIDLFLTVNPKLHEKIKHQIDDMVGEIMQSIFDEGINIYVETQYNEKINGVIVRTKANMIKLLFDESE